MSLLKKKRKLVQVLIWVQIRESRAIKLNPRDVEDIYTSYAYSYAECWPKTMSRLLGCQGWLNKEAEQRRWVGLWAVRVDRTWKLTREGGWVSGLSGLAEHGSWPKKVRGSLSCQGWSNVKAEQRRWPGLWAVRVDRTWKLTIEGGWVSGLSGLAKHGSLPRKVAGSLSCQGWSNVKAEQRRWAGLWAVRVDRSWKLTREGGLVSGLSGLAEHGSWTEKVGGSLGSQGWPNMEAEVQVQ